MSGVAKGVGKVFKKAAKVVKKVAPIALGAAAVYFTAGAALGFAPTLGAAAGSLVGSSVLGNTTLASVVTGAITQAGYGAAIGGLTAAATGGSISKGMQTGALTGAVTGGVTGGLGMNTDPLSGLNGAEATAAGGSPVPGSALSTGTAGPGAADLNAAIGTATGGAIMPSAAPQSTGLMSWLNNNQTLVGTTVAGLGQGLMAGDDTEAKRATIFDKYQQFNKAMVDFAVDTGVLSRESADMFSQHADYVPFYRQMDEDPAKDSEPLGPRLRKSLNNPDPGIKKLEGGTARVGDLLDNISRNAMALAKAGMRNEALRRTHDLMNELGEADTPGAQDSKEGAISYYKNGRKVYFIPHDPMLTTAVAGFTQEQRSNWYKAAAWVTDVIRDGITMFPAFTVSNQLRGTMAAWVQTGANFGMAGNTAKGMIRALKEDAVAREMKTIAGVGGYTFGGTPEEIGKMLRRRLGAHAAWMPDDIVKRAVRPLEKAGEVSELSDRIAIYENLLAKGSSKAEAAYQALNVMNYTRKGANKTLRWLIPLVPFLNARIQGLYRLGETASTPGGRKRIMMGIAARGLLLTAASMGILASYDDDDWARYDDMPLEVKLNYYLIFTDEGVVRIPKPFEFGALFSTLPELMVDAIRRKDGRDLAKGTMMTFLNTFSFLPVPAALLTPAEIALNFDTFRMAPLENQSQQRLAPGLRANANTSGTAREIGRRLDISPIKLEHAINGILGTFGGTFLSATDSIMAAAGLIPEKPAGNFGNIPVVSDLAQSFLGRFYRANAEMGSRSIGKFYDLKEQVDEVYNSVRELQRQGRRDEAMEMLSENRAMLAAKRGLDKISDHMSDVNARIRRVRDSRSMTGEQKQEMLEKLSDLRNRVARRGAQYEYRIQDAQERMGSGQ